MKHLLSALRAAAEISRLRIIAILMNSELTVSEIIEVLNQSQPRVSRHLKLLCESRILDRYQEGSRVFHRLSDAEDMTTVINGLRMMINLNSEEFKSDQERLKRTKDKNALQAAEYFSTNAAEWDQIRKMAVPDADIESTMIEQLGNHKPDLLVDLGTGTGRMLQIFSPYISRGIGIDLNREMLQLARSNLDSAGVSNCTVRQNDFNDLPFDSNSVDAIVIHQVLHYTDRPENVLIEASRVLKTGGQLSIVDFLPHDLEFLRDNHAHRRLGFSDSVISDWGKICKLKVSGIEHLQPKHSTKTSLSVGLWNFVKS